MTPAAPLIALPLLVAAWLAARRAMRGRRSRALDLLRIWSAMLALSCVLFLAAWLVSLATDLDGPMWAWRTVRVLLAAAWVPPVHALRSTLLRLIGRLGSGGGRQADLLRTVAWVVFAAVMLTCAHAMGMGLAFPYAGGIFHGMFAYSDEGRVEVALFAWRWSVLVLGVAVVVFGSGWIPLPWWAMTLAAVAVGLKHWWMVVDWHGSPQSTNFHRVVVWLFIALPFAVALIAAAGAGLRRVLGRRRGAPVP